MNFFIFGSRRSGKTTKAVEIIHTLKLPVVIVGLFSKRDFFKREYPELKIYDNNKGLGPHIRVYEDFRTESMYPLEFAFQAHTIVTATPDNHVDDPETEAYKLYKWAISKKWAIIDLGSPFKSDEADSLADHLPYKSRQGEIYGKWYDRELEYLKGRADKSILYL